MPIITHTVTDKHVGKRLDIYIGHYEPQLSRNRIQSLIREGLALVDRRTEKPGYKVKLGEGVLVDDLVGEDSPARKAGIKPDDIVVEELEYELQALFDH